MHINTRFTGPRVTADGVHKRCQLCNFSCLSGSCRTFSECLRACCLSTGVNAAGDAGDTSPPIFWLGGTSTGISPPILLCTFGYSRPILVALRSLSLKPISFGYKTPPVRFSQAGGQSAHKATAVHGECNKAGR